MPRLIQTVPTGLLSILNAKDGGLGPITLSDEAKGVIELIKFYGMQERRSRFLSFTAATIDVTGGAPGWSYTGVLAGGVFTGANFVVPDGQIWHVLGLSLALENVTGTVNVTPGWAFKDPSVGTPGEAIETANGTGNVAAGTKGVAGSLVDIWALPGAMAAFYIRQWGLGVNDCDVGLSINYEVFTL